MGTTSVRSAITRPNVAKGLHSMNLPTKDEWDKILKRLLWAIGGLLVLHVIWNYLSIYVWPDNRIIRDIAFRLGVDNEASLPTWFAQFLALVSAGLAYFLARNAKSRPEKKTWWAVAIVLLLISIDEVAAIHELVLQGLHIWADLDSVSFINSAWLLLLPIILFSAGLLVWTIDKGLYEWQRRQLLVAIAVYLSGAVGVELLASQADKSSFIYIAFWTTLDEGLELIGLWLFVKTMSKAILRHHTEKHEDRHI